MSSRFRRWLAASWSPLHRTAKAPGRRIPSHSPKMLTDGQGNASAEMASGLAEEVIRTFGKVRLRVFGTSMAPAILPGDLVLVCRARLDEISLGDIVLFIRNGRFFVHRAVGIKMPPPAAQAGESSVITRGDRLQHDDPPVSSSEFLGRVERLSRDGRQIALDPRGPRGIFARALRASDHLTFFYVRLLAGWHSLFLRGVKCRA